MSNLLKYKKTDGAINSIGKRKSTRDCRCSYGADYGARTRYLNLGKVALYQMS